jgi:hypothetical protein
MYLWRAVDHEGEVLDTCLSSADATPERRWGEVRIGQLERAAGFERD